MAILCIDTATERGTVAVAREDGRVSSATWRAAGRHAENLFGHIDRALAGADVRREQLSLIGVDIGPGKFTSLRVGLSTAKGLAFGLGLPVVGVGSLRVLARSIAGPSNYARVALLNAYRGEVFGAAYTLDEGSLHEVVAPSFGPPAVVFDRIGQAVGTRAILAGGEGARDHADVLRSVLGIEIAGAESSVEATTPGALVAEVQDVMRRTGPSDLDSLEPQYLRPSDAKLPERALGSRRER